MSIVVLCIICFTSPDQTYLLYVYV